MCPIPAWKEKWVLQLHDQGMSQRQICKRTKVARGTVATIIKGKRYDYEGHRREREARESLADAPQEKCPGCGRIVTMPCPACLARGHQELRRRPRVEPLERVIDRGPPPGMQLRPPHEARYRKIHDRKARRREAGWE